MAEPRKSQQQSRMRKNLRNDTDMKVNAAAAVYLAGVIEYVAVEVLELAGDQCLQDRKKRIIPRHVSQAINNDVELKELLKDIIIPDGGVTPHIQPELLQPKSTKKASKRSDVPSQEY